MATPQGAVTSLRSGLLGDAPGRAGRRSCHRARGTRTPGRCAPGSAPLGQRLRSRRETSCAPWGARPNARSRGRVAGDRRCSRGVRSSAGAGRSVDAGAGKRRARRGSADVPAPDPRGPQAPAARGAEAGQAAGLVSPPRDGSITATRRRRGRTGPLRNHTHPAEPAHPGYASAPNALIHIARACIRLLSLHLFSASIAFLSRHRSFTSHTLAPAGAHDHSCVTKRRSKRVSLWLKGTAATSPESPAGHPLLDWFDADDGALIWRRLKPPTSRDCDAGRRASRLRCASGIRSQSSAAYRFQEQLGSALHR